MPDSNLLIFGAITLILVTGAAIGLVLHRYRKQRPYAVAISSISMQETWDAWMSGNDLQELERDQRDKLLDALDQEAVEAVLVDLLRLEAVVEAGKYPLTAIRKELMASVDRRMLNVEILRLPDEIKQNLRAQSTDVIQTDEQMQRYIVANELRLRVLREYAARRYGDKGPRDWFAVYEKASRMKQRNARAFLEHSITGVTAPGENARHQAMTIVDNQLRMRLLQVPPGTEFPDIQTEPPSRSIH